MPARVALALQADGWWVRSEIIWNKPNPMPESVTDRPTNAHEKVFLLSKSGDKLFWTHQSFDGVRVQPEPDYVYRLWEKVDGLPGHRDLKKETPIEPAGWRDDDNWQRVNLWRGHDYFYDAEAVRGASITGDTRRPYGSQGAWELDGRPDHQKHGGQQRDNPDTGANLRNVWKITTKGFKEAHFATFPPDLVEPCVKAGTSEHGACGECGAPWTRVAKRLTIIPETGQRTAPKA